MFMQLMTVLNKKHKLECIVLFIGAFFCAMLETLGVSVIVPFVLVMFSPNEMMSNKYVIMLSRIIHISSYHQLLCATATLIVLVFLLKNVSLLFFQYYKGLVHNTIEKELMTQQYRMFMLRPYSYYLGVNSAEVMRGLGTDISQVVGTLDGFICLASELLTVLMIGTFVVFMDPMIAIGLITTALVIAFVFIIGFKKKSAEFGEKCREIFYDRSKLVLESVSGYKEISISQKKQFFVDKYDRINEKACKLNTKYLFVMGIPSRAIETLFVAALLVLACIRIGNYNDNAHFVSLIGALAVSAIRILPSISNISSDINGLVSCRAGMEAAYNNIEQVTDEEIKYNIKSAEIIQGKSIKVFRKKIELKNVTFRYDRTDIDILKDICMTIHCNESVGIIGESGAGKSTLLDVLLGLLKPQSGAVYMDGYNIEDIPFDWASNVGYVPQSVFLLDDTIRNNIAFGIASNQIDDEKIWECIHEAQLEEFIKGLPDGIDTKVGERGVRFSGGQRQRVAIARALYHNPSILVLDEATSALDNETEREVMNAIDRFRGKLTIIIVAHRLSTIENCNTVYRVEKGSIFEEKRMRKNV